MRPCFALAPIAFWLAGCSSSPAAGPGAAGAPVGAGGSIGSGGAGGAPQQPSGGSGGAGPGASGGSTAAGTSSGGSSSGGMSGGGSGPAPGGASAGGSAGASGGAGGGSPGGAPVKSAGCGKAGRPSGGEVVVPDDRIYDFPESYDGNEPMPLVIALHGANNPNTILQTLSDGSRLETKFVRAFPKSNGSAWSFSGGTGADSQRISSIYDEALASYCIDTSRVFLMGHSSGAQMATQMMCKTGGDPRFKAVAPVAASKYCDTLTPVPVMYIQGMMDAQRGNGNGANVVAVFSSSNSCTAQTMPYAPVMACNSDFDSKPVDPGCVSYQGCSEPTIWCSHNDNTYNLTDGHQHGWPCFASDAIADFFLSLP